MSFSISGIVPYLYLDDVGLAVDWYTRVFGFTERGRWADDKGNIANAEMLAGNMEIWLDGSGRKPDADERPNWIGVWVDDVDAVYARVTAAGVACDAPVDREFGVRMLNVSDDLGYTWGFIKRTD